MGLYGNGYFYHRFHKFPIFPYITKTITLNPKKGYPFAVIPTFNSVYNKVSLHNPGIYEWLNNIDQDKLKNNTISIYPSNQWELICMVRILLDKIQYRPIKIEVNMSCPNMNGRYPKFDIPTIDGVQWWLKLNYKQDPNQYSTKNIEGIRLNSIPTTLFGINCGVSGKKAQKVNWEYIWKYRKKFNISGCSWYDEHDIRYLVGSLGCKEISIGSVIINNPKVVEKLKNGIEV